MLRSIFISPLTKPTFAYSRCKSFQFRSFFSSSKKAYDHNAKQERLALLKEIYSPLMKFHKGSQEGIKLIESGKVWEKYFCPFEWRTQDYDFQMKNVSLLKEIDALKASAKVPAVDILRHKIVSFTQQSCAIEGNELGIKETQEVWNSLKMNHNLDNLLKNREILLPAPSSLSDKPEKDVIEIRNHLLATYSILSNTLEREINLDDIKRIHHIILKDTSKEKVKLENNEIQRTGEFRMVEVRAYGFHLTVYPYSMEVPALMEKFMQFHNECIKNNQLHPLIIACRILSTFLHIHPFIDGNGRVGRLIMALYLIRNGYPPVIFQQITPAEYATALFSAQAMKEPTSLYSTVVINIFNILMNYQNKKM